MSPQPYAEGREVGCSSTPARRTSSGPAGEGGMRPQCHPTDLGKRGVGSGTPDGSRRQSGPRVGRVDAAFYSRTSMTRAEADEHDRTTSALATATAALADAQLRTEVDLAELRSVTKEIEALTVRLL